MSSLTVAAFLHISTLVLLCEGETIIDDEHFRHACGPISCLVALRSLGVETSLAQIAHECDWHEGESTQLSRMAEVLQSYSWVSCQLAHLSPRELCDLISDDQTVVILAIRKHSAEVNHAVCATSVGANGQVKLVDYPEMVQHKTLPEIADAWDGAALVVRASPGYRAFQKFALCFGPLVTLMVGLATLRKWLRQHVVATAQEQLS